MQATLMARRGSGFPILAGRSRPAHWCPEAAALFSRMSVAPTSVRQRQIDAAIRSLKDAGIWTKLDALYVLAAHDAQAARLNWKQGAFDLTPVNGPVFSPDSGYQGDGSTTYLDTGFNPVVAGGQFSLADECHFAWVESTVPSGNTGNWVGNAYARLGRGASSVNTRSNTLVGQTNDTAGNFTQLFAVSRTVSASYDFHRNGVKVATHALTAESLNNENFSLLRGAGFYSAARLCVGGFGRGLTETELSALYGTLSTYLQAVGAS